MSDIWAKVTSDEHKAIRYKHLVSDVFITSANAITVDGQMVNVDGVGNRVASTIFGPKKVIVVVGMNKVVQDLEEALARSREVAGVMNAIRLRKNPPCTDLGYCTDCKHSGRICNVTVILHRRPQEYGKFFMDYHVILTGETAGF